MLARDLKYSSEYLTPEECLCAFPPETAGGMDAITRLDENLEDARAILSDGGG